MLVTVLLFCAAAAGWGTKTLITPPSIEIKTPQYSIITAKTGKLSRTVEIKTTAKLQKIAVITAKLSGTLTSINTAREATVNPGDLLGTVDLLSIRALPGSTPVFRELTQGIEGSDVSQLQSFLYTKYGLAATPTGKYDYQTTNLVKRWQKENGDYPSGSIPLGSIVFIPNLPAQIVWEKDLLAGETVSAETKLATVYGGPPQFVAKIPPAALDAISEGTVAKLKYKKYTWLAELSSTSYDAESQQWLGTLIPPTGTETICGSDCGVIPAAGLNSITTQVVTVPEQKGVLIPTSAIRVDKNNRTVVVDKKGKNHPIEIKLSLSGQAIVDGIAAGTHIRSWITHENETGK